MRRVAQVPKLLRLLNLEGLLTLINIKIFITTANTQTSPTAEAEFPASETPLAPEKHHLTS
jgi:hypothetical protein